MSVDQNATSTEQKTAAPSEEEIVTGLKKQIDYYFSKENLSTDRWLVSQMDSENYVPIHTIASFKGVRTISSDLNLIATAMKQLESVQLDEKRGLVRPTLRQHRNIIILREIPSSTPEQDIRGIFAESGSQIAEIRAEVGDMWYVTLQNEDQAVQILEKIRNQTFLGQPVRARIKQEANFRNINQATVAIPAPTPIPAGFVQPAPPSTRGKSKGKKSQPAKAENRKRTPSVHVEHTLSNFPPLPNASDAKPSGYTEAFQKWSRHDFVTVLENLSDISKPDSMNTESPIVLSEPRKTSELDFLSHQPKQSEVKSSDWTGTNDKVKSPPPKSAGKTSVSPLTPQKE